MKIFAILLSLIFVTGLAAQPSVDKTAQSRQEQKTEKVKKKIGELGTGEKAHVRVRLYNDSTYKGYVDAAHEDDFMIVDAAGGHQTVHYADVRSINGRNLSTGAKIGIGVGIGVVATLGILAILIVHSLN